MVFCLEAGKSCESDFGCWGSEKRLVCESSKCWDSEYIRRSSFDTRYFDSVFTYLLEFDALQLGSDITVVILRSLNLIKQLGGNRIDGHPATRVLLLVYHTFAFFVDIADWESEVDVLALLEEIFEI